MLCSQCDKSLALHRLASLCQCQWYIVNRLLDSPEQCVWKYLISFFVKADQIRNSCVFYLCQWAGSHKLRELAHSLTLRIRSTLATLQNCAIHLHQHIISFMFSPSPPHSHHTTKRNYTLIIVGLYHLGNMKVGWHGKKLFKQYIYIYIYKHAIWCTRTTCRILTLTNTEWKKFFLEFSFAFG